MASPFASTMRVLATGGLFWAVTGQLLAQAALGVEHGGKVYPVHRVVRGHAYIKLGDKELAVNPIRSMLVPQPEFRPVFVSVRDLEVKTSRLSLVGTGNEINNEFHFNATFASSYHLQDPFLVLELDLEKSGKRLFFQEIGELTPGHLQWVRVTVALPENLGPGKFKLHVFSGGFEVLHSQQPWQFREGVLNQMVLKRIAGVADAPPRPFVGPAPDYPKALKKSRVKGEAMLTIHLTRQGVVTDPKVDSATDPAFGEAALAAVRQWRFLPKIEAGRPVETDVRMPFAFDPPGPDEKS